MRLLVCGGRGYLDFDTVSRHLNDIAPEVVMTGGARGADQQAERWAEENGVPLMVFPAFWNRYGKAAGPIRNGWMLEYGDPHRVLAFPGGPGTADMVKQAKAKGIPVMEVTVAAKAPEYW